MIVAKLPELLDRKIYKTGQTRGADDDVIYQNRVSRNSTVLIPYNLFELYGHPPDGEESFDKGFIVLIEPAVYFETENMNQELADKGLELGVNAAVFYEKRSDWLRYPPPKKWRAPSSRLAPIGGEMIARIAGTTAQREGDRIRIGYAESGLKGAGIRLFEYASKDTISDCRTQLELLHWLCVDSIEAAATYEMRGDDARERRSECIEEAKSKGLTDFKRLKEARVTNDEEVTICPLCLEPLSAVGFYARLSQAEGREVHDLTVTEINLFHIDEVRYGAYNHRPYNLGWGHHHCNVVVKDSGIDDTLDWMKQVVIRNNKM